LLQRNVESGMTWKGILLVAAGLGAVLGAPETAIAQSGGQPAYVGRWADQASWCRNRLGTTDEIPFTISARGLEGMEWGCRFLQVTGSHPQWRITASCSGEGMTNRERFIFRVEGNVLRFTYVDRGNRTDRAVRCP
jgi:hypothetical protein